MRNLVSILSLVLLMSSNVFAATGSGNISNVVTFGGVNTTDSVNLPISNPENFTTLYSGGPGGFSALNFYPLYKDGVAYQVANAKSFYVHKICILSTTANATAQLMTATASFAVNASSVTGGVYQMGAAQTGNVGPLFAPTSANTWACYSQTFKAAQNTYMGVQSGSATTYAIQVFGVER